MLKPVIVFRIRLVTYKPLWEPGEENEFGLIGIGCCRISLSSGRGATDTGGRTLGKTKGGAFFGDSLKRRAGGGGEVENGAKVGGVEGGLLFEKGSLGPGGTDGGGVAGLGEKVP